MKLHDRIIIVAFISLGIILLTVGLMLWAGVCEVKVDVGVLTTHAVLLMAWCSFVVATAWKHMREIEDIKDKVKNIEHKLESTGTNGK